MLLQNYYREAQGTIFYKDQERWTYTEMSYQENTISNDEINLQKLLEQEKWHLLRSVGSLSILLACFFA